MGPEYGYSVFPNGPRSGALILDTSCLKRLTDSSVRQRLVAQLRVIDFTPWPSAINAIEVAALPDSRHQARYQEVLRFLAEDRILLPWPLDVLKDVGEAAIRRDRIVKLRPSGLDFLIREPIGPRHLQTAQQVMAQSAASWDRVFGNIQKKVREHLRERQMKSAWSEVPAFLDSVLADPVFLRDFMGKLWASLGSPGKPPVELLVENKPWRALVEAHGVLAFERSFTGGSEPPRAHVWDVMQLIYMAGPERKILVTEDKPFLRAATAVLHGRYPNALALHWHEFLE